MNCGYVKAADVADRFGNPSSLNPDKDPDIVGPAGIFTQAEYDGRTTSSARRRPIMKMVVEGYAGAGTHHDGRLRLPRPGCARPAKLQRLARGHAAWARASNTPPARTRR